MGLYLAKLLMTSALIVLISEVAKRSDKFGALIAALPLTTLLVISWMYIENQTDKKIANHMVLTFYFVLPTLPMFLLFPYLISKLGFQALWLAELSSPGGCYICLIWAIKNLDLISYNSTPNIRAASHAYDHCYLVLYRHRFFCFCTAMDDWPVL